VKLVIQIPCYNEAENLGEVLRDIPRSIKGVDTVEVLVIDDGSSDRTRDVAIKNGADHLVVHPQNMGLAAAFRAGFEKCRRLGADIVVNTDGDNQYDSAQIERLIEPVVSGLADVVVGDRAPSQLQHFSFLKRQMQKVGSRVVSHLAGMNIPDATSGFRAYSRNALYRLTIETSFSHSLETLMQAASKGLVVTSIPISARHTLRKSRLARSSRHFIWRSVASLVRLVTYYRPLSFYWTLGISLSLIGGAPMLRFLWFFLQGDGRGHVQSLVIGGALLAMGFACLLFGVMAAQIASNRRLLEELNERLRQIETDKEKGQTKSLPPRM